METLRCPPAGEPTVPFFHTKPERADEFRELFRRRFGDAYALLTTDDLERLELLGPAPLTTVTRARVGDLVGIAQRPTALYYRQRGVTITPHLGVHAGLTPGEMTVPLVVV